MKIRSINRVGVEGRAGRMLLLGGLLAALGAAGCAAGVEDDETVSVQGALNDYPLCTPACPLPNVLRQDFGGSCRCLPTFMPTFTPIQNLARLPGNTVNQSSTDFGGDALRAIDGNTSGLWWNNSVTHTKNVGPVPAMPPGATSSQQWWSIWFPAIRAVRHMTIYNRTDCCGERIGSITIWGMNPGGGAWMNLGGARMNGNPVIDIDLWDVNTQFFLIQKNDNDYLSLAEVQIWGLVL